MLWHDFGQIKPRFRLGAVGTGLGNFTPVSTFHITKGHRTREWQ